VSLMCTRILRVITGGTPVPLFKAEPVLNVYRTESRKIIKSEERNILLRAHCAPPELVASSSTRAINILAAPRQIKYSFGFQQHAVTPPKR
jgi:hypothetical protein